MLKKTIVSSILLLVSSLGFSGNLDESFDLFSLQKLENTILSCPQISENINDPRILRCYTNGHNLIKENINRKINKLKNRDKVSLLNTKGLNFEVVRFSCFKNYSNKILIKECEVYADLAYLDYIISRYY